MAERRRAALRSRVRLSEILVVGTVLVLTLWWIRFPILFPDSHRYLRGALLMKTNPVSPIVLPVLLGPLARILGPWAFVGFASTLLMMVSLEVSHAWFRCARPWIVAGTILVTGAGVMAGTVMMDIYTALAMLGLLVLAKRRSSWSSVAVIVGGVAHASTLPALLLPALALSVVCRTRRPMVHYGLLVAFQLIASTALNWTLDGRFSSSPRHSSLHYAWRIVHDVPESLQSFAERHPATHLALHRELLLETPRRNLPGPYLWGEDPSFTRAGRDEIAREARSLILHTLRHHTVALVRSVCRRTWGFVSGIGPRRLRTAFVRPPAPADDVVQRFFPERRGEMRRGLQARGEMGQVLFPSAFAVLAWLSLVSLPLLGLAGLRSTDRGGSSGPAERGRGLVPWVLILYCLGDAAVSSAATGVARLLARMLFPPVLWVVLEIAAALEGLWRSRRGAIGW